MNASRRMLARLSLTAGSLRRSLSRGMRLTRALAEVRLGRVADSLRGERIWLFGGSSGRKYADNSAALHRYVRRNHPEIRAIWVISRSSPDVERAREQGEILFLEDPKAFVYGLLAEVHVVSHGVHDVPACASRFSRALKVRVGHGLTALKPRRSDRLEINPLDSVFHLVPVSSEFEARNKLDWGLDEAKVCVTGMARLDDLLELSATVPRAMNPRRILFMPTARDWLVGRKGEFQRSEFKARISEFLVAANESLSRNQIRMWFYVHPLMADHFAAMKESFGLSQVDILPVNADFQRVLVESSLLITDYSSVAWDALYIQRPVLFFHFDFDEFFRERGKTSHLDWNEDMFGPVARTSAQAVEEIEKFATSDFASNGYDEAMERWRERAFVAVDGRNCKRVLDAILGRLAVRNGR